VPDSQSSAPYTVIILAGVLGFLLSGGVAFLIEYLNDTVRSTDDVTRRLCLPSLGSIKPNREGAGTDLQSACVVVRIQACRNLEGETGGKLILVTSPKAEQGKSVTAINLAIVWAKMGQETILVDAHLRHPILHEWLDLSSDVGTSLGPKT